MADANKAAESRQFLTFTLGDGEEKPESAAVHAHYGIDLKIVQEIRGYTPATPFPNAAPHVKGAINLRGAVIPVLDLRLRFGLPDPQYNKFTVVIVISIHGKTIGLVADSVSDVIALAVDRILPSPDFGPRQEGDCVQGLTELESGLVMILDLERMLTADGILEVSKAA